MVAAPVCGYKNRRSLARRIQPLLIRPHTAPWRPCPKTPATHGRAATLTSMSTGRAHPLPPASARALIITRSRRRCVTLSCTAMRKSDRSGVTTPKRPTCPPLVLAGCERCSSPSPTDAHTNTCGANPEPKRVVPASQWGCNGRASAPTNVRACVRHLLRQH